MNNETTMIRTTLPETAHFSQQPLPVGTLIEGFEIRGVIGVGGFGIVYKAWDAMLERQVALKEYLPASLALRIHSGEVKVRDSRHRDTFAAGLRSFINEARLLAQFDHTALVKVYRFWEMAGTAYMVMPLYQGITLKQYAEQHSSPLAENQLLHWLAALTEALEVMHAQQCYHRDISPENIIIQEGTNLPILLDFGAARRAIGNASQPFTVILKASYAPIEQYAEVRSLPQGPWTDVYALAAVAHFLITGKTPPSSVSRLVNDSYLPLRTQGQLPVSMQMKLAIDHALAVQPQERTASMAAFREALLQPPQADVLSLFDKPIEPNVEPIIEPVIPLAKAVKVEQSFVKKYRAIAALVIAGIALALGFNMAAKQPGSQSSEVAPELPTESAKNNTATVESSSGIDPVFIAVLNRATEALTIQLDNPVLKIGEDLLRFRVQSPIDGYVAVYVRTSEQSLIQLLPNARVPSLKIEAGMPLTLPPATEPIQAAGPAGDNQFLVVVTQHERNYAHLNLQDHYGFGLIQSSDLNKVVSTPQLEGLSACANIGCQDRLAATWFSIEEVN